MDMTMLSRRWPGLRGAAGAAALLIGLLAGQPQPARAHSEASLALSLMPVASVLASGTGVALAGAALPLALSASGALLTVTALQASAIGTVYVLERASDGARVSVEVAGRAAQASAVGVGTLVSCSVIGSGVILSVAGEVLAFVPNALGRALLYNERL
ncbi:hypothetical protein MASR1M59_13270 [Melaminivora sp.]